MKKFYSFVLLAATLLLSTNIWAGNVSNLAELQTALQNGGDITLTDDITTNATLSITKSVVINGNGHAVTGSAQNVFSITASNANVQFNNININAVHNSGCAIDWKANQLTLKLDGVVIQVVGRGISDAPNGDVLSGLDLTISNSTISKIKYENGTIKNLSYDKEYVNNSSYRGISLWSVSNSEIKIENSTIQGFAYDINAGGTTNDMKLTANNSTFKGRAALNVWGSKATYIFNDCSIIGINNQTGDTESFACFVFNSGNVDNNALTINGGTSASVSMSQDAVDNNHATQYLVRAQGANNKIIINNADYEFKIPFDDGVYKGGIVEYSDESNTVEINGGNYKAPCIARSKDSYTQGNHGTITINGGNFTIDKACGNADVAGTVGYITVNGGTFDKKLTLTDGENTLLGSGMAVIPNQNGTTSVVPSEVANATKTISSNETLQETTEKSNVIVTNGAQVNVAADASVYRLDMAENTTITVKAGHTLTIGTGGVALQNETTNALPTIIVEPGARVIAKGLFYGSKAENIVLNASETVQAQFIIAPDVQSYGDNHPNATVAYVSKSITDKAQGIYTKQRFGIPTFTAPESISATDEDGKPVPTAFDYFDYTTTHDWELAGYINVEGKDLDYSKMSTPFQYYQMQNNTTTPGTIVTFKGALYGNANPKFEVLANSWNGYANSLMVNIGIIKMFDAIPNTVDRTIYLSNIDEQSGSASWESKTLLDLEETDVIKPMEAFLIRNTNVAVDMDLDYTTHVYNPALGISTNAQKAPSRMMSDVRKVKLVVRGENSVDRLTIAESSDFTEDFDNGYDAVKYMNEGINLYVNADEAMSCYATNNLNNTYIGFESVQAGQYTITFTNVSGEAFTLVDLETGAKTLMKEGATYTFTAEANTIADHRFKVITAEAPTSVENIANMGNAEGIYTILGQYVGEMNIWNTLPAGIYVVNGEKVVK